MNQIFTTSSNFQSLSLMDLIQARDANHYSLISKKNVVATAIGLYRIRHDDPWPTREQPSQGKKKVQRKKRTLFNSEIRPYSWPCIYVFVSEWETEADLAKENVSDVVPKTVAFDKGRVHVPVCIIEAKKQSYSKDLKINRNGIAPRNFYGPGNPVINRDAQGINRIATAGCIVKDSEKYYVLTNKHASGKKGTMMYSVKGYQDVPIGTTSVKGISRKNVKEVYPHFLSEYQYLQMDIGLIEVDDIKGWKTDIAGIPNVEDVLDLYDNNFTLQLIGCKVTGLSAISGMLHGEIQGLFYRYKAIGGYEYLSDFLIGPRSNPEQPGTAAEETERGFNVHHGDSGTLLLLEYDLSTSDDIKVVKYFPFALLWGRHEFIESKAHNVQPYALATSLSTAINILNLDFVKDIALDNDFIWGYDGHYAIGSKLEFSIRQLKSSKLMDFVKKNMALLTLQDDIVGNDPRVLVADASGKYNIDDPNFVPLADVPDNVWKTGVNFYMVPDPDNPGKKKRKAGPGTRHYSKEEKTFEDNANHFADIDLSYKEFDRFIDFNLNDVAKNLNPETWMAYYNSKKTTFEKWDDNLGKPHGPQYKHWGALPFRVQQLFNLMVAYAAAGKQEEFLTAGGVLIHYVGDACQPLHTSYLSQGDPDKVIDKPQSDGKKMEADGVHGGYEDDMVDYGYSEDNLISKLEKEITRQNGVKKEAIDPIKTGLDAARAILVLAGASQETLPPRDIVDKWVELLDIKKKDRAAPMWESFGKQTITCMARGCRYLAAIWQAAWDKADGDNTIGEGKKLKEEDIMALYNDPAFAESRQLDDYDLAEPTP